MLPSPETPSTQAVNRHSIISLILGIATLIFFCGGILVPIPLTSFICVPVSSIFGLVGLIYGVISLKRIKMHAQSGRPLAWAGILIGGFVFFCMICSIIALWIVWHTHAIHNFPTPPFIQNFEI
ncbi:MAG: DUF4190 domain-containing protein [Anaerolineales bacterium]|nr:DUF4190 domain-containing protein [Anaerolineales bacterium]